MGQEPISIDKKKKFVGIRIWKWTLHVTKKSEDVRKYSKIVLF